MESKKTYKKAHEVESDLVISLFTCLHIKKEMLIKWAFDSKMEFLPLRGFKVRPCRELRDMCIVQLNFKDFGTKTQR